MYPLRWSIGGHFLKLLSFCDRINICLGVSNFLCSGAGMLCRSGVTIIPVVLRFFCLLKFVVCWVFDPLYSRILFLPSTFATSICLFATEEFFHVDYLRFLLFLCLIQFFLVFSLVCLFCNSHYYFVLICSFAYLILLKIVLSMPLLVWFSSLTSLNISWSLWLFLCLGTIMISVVFHAFK